MGSLSQAMAFGIWPALPLSGHWMYVRFGRPQGKTPFPKLTLFALVTVAGVALFSLPMLLSAALGSYRAEWFGLIGWAITVPSLWKSSKRREVFSAIRNLRLRGWNLVLTIGLTVSAVLYLAFPSETILGGRDEGTYANHAVYIARHGRVDIPYPYPAESASVFKEALYRHPYPDVLRQFAMGFHITSPNMKVRFGHLFSVWLAQAYSTFGHHGLFRLNALFSLLSLCVFYGLCRSAMPQPYAVVATLFLALNSSQILLTRTTLAEILTQLLIWSGLLLLAEAVENHNKTLARWAGISIGFSAVVRIDNFLLLPLLILSHLVLRVNEEPASEKISSVWLAFYPPTFILSVFAAVYYALFTTPYFIQLQPRLLTIGIVTLILFFVLWMPDQIILKRLQPYIQNRGIFILVAILLVALVAYAYWVRPHLEPFSVLDRLGRARHGTRDFREDSLVNLAQYISPFVICAAVLGWWLMVRNALKHNRYACFMGVIVVTFGFSFLYLWNPMITPGNFWAIRRFVPVVIPGMIFFAGLGISYTNEQIPKKLSKFVSVSALAILMLFTIKSDALIFSLAENRGLFRQIQQLADHLPQDEIILCDHWIFPPPWEAPLYFSFDRRIAPVDLNSKAGLWAARNWFAMVTTGNRPCYALYDSGPLVNGLDGTKLYETKLSRRFLEGYPLPKTISKEERTIRLYKINSMISNYSNVGLGSEKWFGVLESGFHGQEWAGGKPFRWTNGHATLAVPLNPEHPPRVLRVQVGVHPANRSEVRILLNRGELYRGQIGEGVWSKTFNLGDLQLGKEATIEIISGTFVPKERIKGSTDTRTLGVTVQDIRLLGGN